MIRSFIAVDLPPEIQVEVHQLISQLRKEAQCPVGWVNAQNIHITLKFLGDIQAEKVQNIRRVVSDIPKTIDSFQISIEGLGVFPSLNKPRIIWVGCQFDDFGLDLQFSIEKALEREGFKKENRKFHPHLTIGRVRNHASKPDLQTIANIVNCYQDFVIGSMQVKQFHLYRSDLLPGGAKYNVLHTFTLADE